MAISRISQSTVQAGFPKFNNTWDGLSAVGSMEPISAITLASTSDSLTFNNIPGTYSHLQLRYIARTTRTEIDDNMFLEFNDDATTNYRYHYLGGNGTSASAYGEGSMTGILVPFISAASSGANTFGVGVCDILDYQNTSKNTVARTLGGNDTNGAGWVALKSGLWLNTAAVTSIKIKSGTLGDLVQNSSFSLYGIK